MPCAAGDDEEGEEDDEEEGEEESEEEGEEVPKQVEFTAPYAVDLMGDEADERNPHLDACRFRSIGSLINTHTDPEKLNCKYAPRLRSDRPCSAPPVDEDRLVIIVATKDIQRGEELYCDYGDYSLSEPGVTHGDEPPSCEKATKPRAGPSSGHDIVCTEEAPKLPAVGKRGCL